MGAKDYKKVMLSSVVSDELCIILVYHHVVMGAGNGSAK